MRTVHGEYKSESYTMTTKADGTWEWTNNKGDKANLNADGTWESFDAQRNERVHVNPMAAGFEYARAAIRI